MNTAKISAGDTSANISVSIPAESDAGTIRLFIWEDLASIEPLFESRTIQLN